MLCRVLLLILVLPFSVLLGGEKVVPEGCEFEVKWPVNGRVYGLNGPLEMEAGFHCTGGSESCALVWNVSSRALSASNEMCVVDGEEMAKAFLSAVKGESYKGRSEVGDVKIRYETFPAEGGLGVVVARGMLELKFSPENAAGYARMVGDAMVAREWYARLMVAEQVPEWTAEARPPASDRISVYTGLGKVEAGELRLWVKSVFYNNSQEKGSHIIGDMSYGEGEYRERRFAGALISYLSRVKKRIETGTILRLPMYVPAGREATYMVAANKEEKSAEVEMVVGKQRINPYRYKGTGEWSAQLNEEQLGELERLAGLGELRSEWVREHADLFYEERVKFLANDTWLEVGISLSDDGEEDVGGLVTDIHVKEGNAYREPRKEVEISCTSFAGGAVLLGDAEVRAISNAYEAAKKGEDYREVVEGKIALVAESAELYGLRMVKLECMRGRTALSLESVEKMSALMAGAKAAREWYMGLHGVYDVAEPSERAHPSAVPGTKVVLKVGDVSLGHSVNGYMSLYARVEQTLGGEVQVVKEFSYKNQKEQFVLSEQLGGELIDMLQDAFVARRGNEVYMNVAGDADAEYITVTVDEGEKDVRIVYQRAGDGMKVEFMMGTSNEKRFHRVLKEQVRVAELLRTNQKVFFGGEVGRKNVF